MRTDQLKYDSRKASNACRGIHGQQDKVGAPSKVISLNKKPLDFVLWTIYDAVLSGIELEDGF